tara:strand:- start:548 stop:1033 length:486 start_codon:yes stop_codon:yes gene_type:complete
MKVSFHIPGIPVPKQSFRAGGRFGGWQPKRVTQYKKLVQAVALKAKIETDWVKPKSCTPVLVRFIFAWPWPKATKKSLRDSRAFRVTTPDIDNVEKACLDGMGCLWEDDRQVTAVFKAKLNVPRGQEGVTVIVETLEDKHEQARCLGVIHPGQFAGDPPRP